MKASELRIGNYYNQFGNAEKVSWSTLKTLEESTTEQLWCKPIPLTEEWLFKFEIQKENGYPYRFCKGYLKLRNGIYFYKHYNIEINLNYVHQLQNLYFALTNEELTYEQQK